MLKSYKYRLNLNNNQKLYFNDCFNYSRLIYNLGLQTKIQAYQSNRINLSFYDLNKQLVDLKKEYPFLKTIGKEVLQNSLLNLDNAYSNFFKNKKDFPKFKSKHKSNNSVKFNSNLKIDFINNTILIPKIKKIKFINSRSFNGTIKSITVSKNKLNHYFASILVDTEIIKYKPITKELGIDLGLKHFIIDSDSNKINNPRFYRNQEKNIIKHQKRLSRKKKGSKNREKERLKLCKIYLKITNQRNDFLHKLSSKLINDNQIIYIEDLNIAGMIKNHCLAKSIQDASWSEFIRQLDYKSKWYGRELIKIGRFEPTSKKCNCCNHIKDDLELNDREWICDNCHAEHDRDINAAINILNKGKEIRNLGIKS